MGLTPEHTKEWADLRSMWQLVRVSLNWLNSRPLTNASSNPQSP